MSGQAATNTPAPVRYDALNVGSSLMDVPIPIFWGQRRLSTNAIWYGNFKSYNVDGKGKGGGGKSSNQAMDYKAATIVALCEGPLDSVARAWASGSTTSTSSLAQLNSTLFYGTASQAPWSWMSSNDSTQARAYAYTAYLACPQQDLGESATIPDNAYECVRSNGFAYTHSTAGWINPASHVQYTAIDVLLSDCITDLLTNPQYSVLFGAADIGSTAQYAAYLRAQGLFFSPQLYQLEKATSVLDRWAQLSNSWIYWAGTALQFVPLGDSAISANGATYAPQTTVAYSLGLNDFLVEENDAPVKVTRKDPADCPNRTILNITDRTIGYTSNPLEYKNQTLVDQFGLRDNNNIQADDICDPAVGKIVVNLLGQRAANIRNTYTFKTSYRYILCLPGTVLALTEPNIGLNAFQVRVTKIEEDDSLRLTFTCEEFPGNVGTYISSSAGVSGNITSFPNQFVDPGVVNTPAIVEPSSAFSASPKLLIAASGGPNWGGCDVNISFDGTSYQYVGSITAPAPQGVLTAALANHADPDTADTLAVNCAESLAVPLAVTTADADAFRALALVAPQPTIGAGVATVPNGELIAFGDVTSTGTYTANLTYLRRGLYGSSPEAHSVGDQFTVIDTLGQTGTTLAYELPAQYVGQPIYLKLASFNMFGNTREDLSVVQEYVYTPTGAGYGTATNGAPSEPSGVGAANGLNNATISWSANPTTDNVTAYEVWRAPGAGASFASAGLVWQGRTTGWVDATVTASGAYTWFVVAANAIGASTPSAGASASVTLSGSLAGLSSVSQPQIAAGVLGGNIIGLAGTANAYLQINPGSTAGGAVAYTAAVLPMYDASGNMVVAHNFSGAANYFNSVGVGGPDQTYTTFGGTFSAGNPVFLNVFAIYNPTTSASGLLLSWTGNASPTLPAGYTFSIRIGAVKLNYSATYHWFTPTIQQAQETTIVNCGVAGGYLPTIASGVVSGWQTYAVTPHFVPPTAYAIRLLGSNSGSSGGLSAAPNSSYSVFTAYSSNPPPMGMGVQSTQSIHMVLESGLICYNGTGGNCLLQCAGWSDLVAT